MKMMKWRTITHHPNWSIARIGIKKKPKTLRWKKILRMRVNQEDFSHICLIHFMTSKIRRREMHSSDHKLISTTDLTLNHKDIRYCKTTTILREGPVLMSMTLKRYMQKIRSINIHTLLNNKTSNQPIKGMYSLNFKNLS